MHALALMGAKKGRFRPSFFFCLSLGLEMGLGLGLADVPAHAQPNRSESGQPSAGATVYRCGQQYTNAPADVRQCEPVKASPSVVVVPGTRVQTARMPSTAPASMRVSASEPAPVESAQAQRDGLARSVLQAELTQARERQKHLQQQIQEQTHNLPATADSSADAPHALRQKQDQAKQRAALERVQRDIQSIEREMARLPAALPSSRQP